MILQGDATYLLVCYIIKVCKPSFLKLMHGLTSAIKLVLRPVYWQISYMDSLLLLVSHS